MVNLKAKNFLLFRKKNQIKKTEKVYRYKIRTEEDKVEEEKRVNDGKIEKKIKSAFKNHKNGYNNFNNNNRKIVNLISTENGIIRIKERENPIDSNEFKSPLEFTSSSGYTYQAKNEFLKKRISEINSKLMIIKPKENNIQISGIKDIKSSQNNQFKICNEEFNFIKEDSNILKIHENNLKSNVVKMEEFSLESNSYNKLNKNPIKGNFVTEISFKNKEKEYEKEKEKETIINNITKKGLVDQKNYINMKFDNKNTGKKQEFEILEQIENNVKMITLDFYDSYIKTDLFKMICTQKGSIKFQNFISKFDYDALNAISEDIINNFFPLFKNCYAFFFIKKILLLISEDKLISIFEEIFYKRITDIVDNNAYFRNLCNLIESNIPTSCQMIVSNYLTQIPNIKLSEPKFMRIMECCLYFSYDYSSYIYSFIFSKLDRFLKIIKIRQGYFLVRRILKINKKYMIQKKFVDLISKDFYTFISSTNGCLLSQCLIRNFCIDLDSDKSSHSSNSSSCIDYRILDRINMQNKESSDYLKKSSSDKSDNLSKIISNIKGLKMNYHNSNLIVFFELLLKELNYKRINKYIEKLILTALVYCKESFYPMFHNYLSNNTSILGYMLTNIYGSKIIEICLEDKYEFSSEIKELIGSYLNDFKDDNIFKNKWLSIIENINSFKENKFGKNRLHEKNLDDILDNLSDDLSEKNAECKSIFIILDFENNLHNDSMFNKKTDLFNNAFYQDDNFCSNIVDLSIINNNENNHLDVTLNNDISMIQDQKKNVDYLKENFNKPSEDKNYKINNQINSNFQSNITNNMGRNNMSGLNNFSYGNMYLNMMRNSVTDFNNKNMNQYFNNNNLNNSQKTDIYYSNLGINDPRLYQQNQNFNNNYQNKNFNNISNNMSYADKLNCYNFNNMQQNIQSNQYNDPYNFYQNNNFINNSNFNNQNNYYINETLKGEKKVKDDKYNKIYDNNLHNPLQNNQNNHINKK